MEHRAARSHARCRDWRRPAARRRSRSAHTRGHQRDRGTRSAPVPGAGPPRTSRRAIPSRGPCEHDVPTPRSPPRRRPTARRGPRRSCRARRLHGAASTSVRPGARPHPTTTRAPCVDASASSSSSDPSAPRSSPADAKEMPAWIAARASRTSSSPGNADAITSMPGGNVTCSGVGALSERRGSPSSHGVAPSCSAAATDLAWSSRRAGDDHAVDTRRVEQLACRAHADVAEPGDQDGAHRKSGPCSSRQPPVVGGTRPLPRTRTTTLTPTAMAATSNPRWNAFICWWSVPSDSRPRTRGRGRLPA